VTSSQVISYKLDVVNQSKKLLSTPTAALNLIVTSSPVISYKAGVVNQFKK